MSMLPSVDDTTIHMYLGTRQERLREKRLIQDIERQELGLHPESRQGYEQRQAKQKETADRLSVPFPRRVVERKAKHDVLDIRLATKQRQGPLPVDEEIAEENVILARQIQKLRQTGVHLLQGGGGTVNLSASGAGFFGQGERQQQQMLGSPTSTAGSFGSFGGAGGENDNNSNTFLTSLGAGGNDASYGSFGGGGTTQQQQQQQAMLLSSSTSASGNNNNNKYSSLQLNKNVYAGDVLFRPGRLTANLEPSDFWLYTRQKVTQRTLGTQVLQHPVVVGQSTDAESLKQLLLQSPIATIIKKKISNLLAQTINRTRCGILFDLLSTRNIIVSGVPNIVGQIIYEHVADTIGAEHSALKFVFVGITDNSNCCAARDVFCQSKTLQGKSISSTKRGFEALDNVHTFAVAPPGGFETLLGPAALANDLLKEEEAEKKRNESGSPANSRKKKKTGDSSASPAKLQHSSSPLGKRPWHTAMKKSKPQVSATVDPLLQTLSTLNQEEQQQQKLKLSAQQQNDDDDNIDPLLKTFKAASTHQQPSTTFLTDEKEDNAHQHQLNDDENNTNINSNNMLGEDDDGRTVKIIEDEQSKKHKQQMKQLREIENALSPLPTVTHDDLINAFDPRDLEYLPNLATKKSDAVKRWEQNELKHMNEMLVGPTVKLSKMTKRYNTQTPSATIIKKRLRMTPTTFGSMGSETPAAAGVGDASNNTQPQRKTFTIGHEKFLINPRGASSTPTPVSSMAWR